MLNGIGRLEFISHNINIFMFNDSQTLLLLLVYILWANTIPNSGCNLS